MTKHTAADGTAFTDADLERWAQDLSLVTASLLGEVHRADLR